MRILNTFYSMLFNKCPRCHSGNVFKAANPYELDKIFHLHEHCSNCQLKFEREPSFFYGALYVSYALTSGWFGIWFFLFMNDMLPVGPLTLAILVTLSFIVLSPLTIRWSRLIWLNFFYKFDKNLKAGKISNNTHQHA